VLFEPKKATSHFIAQFGNDRTLCNFTTAKNAVLAGEELKRSMYVFGGKQSFSHYGQGQMA
jgi:hypothetical protein